LAASLARHHGHSIYIIPSQLHLDRPRIIERLKAKGTVSLLYVIHDILPTSHPEYFPGYAEARTRRRMQTAARLADVIVANSQDTASEFRRVYGPPRPPSSIVVIPLGTNLPAARQLPGQPTAPYFVMVGTIEPRKNHLLLLNLWKDLRKEMNSATPRLIIVGIRGWKNEKVIALLDHDPCCGVMSRSARGRPMKSWRPS
jgi:glycosyltransferase involved in cell wall biosynthesis